MFQITFTFLTLALVSFTLGNEMNIPEKIIYQQQRFFWPWIPLPHIPTRPSGTGGAATTTPATATTTPAPATTTPATTMCAAAGDNSCRCGATGPTCTATQRCQLIAMMCLPDCPAPPVNTVTRCVCPTAGCTDCGGDPAGPMPCATTTGMPPMVCMVTTAATAGTCAAQA